MQQLLDQLIWSIWKEHTSQIFQLAYEALKSRLMSRLYGITHVFAW